MIIQEREEAPDACRTFVSFLIILFALQPICRVDAQILIRLENVRGIVRGAHAIDDILWFVTTNGLYYGYKDRYEVQKLNSFDNFDRELYSLDVVGDRTLWVGGRNGVYVVRNGKYFPISLGAEIRGATVYAIESSTEGTETTVLLGTDRGLFRIEKGKGSAQPVTLPDNDRSSSYLVKRIEGVTWVATKINTYKVINGEYTKVDPPLPMVDEIVKVGDRHYFLARTKESRDPDGPSGTGSTPGAGVRSLYYHPGGLDEPLRDGVLGMASVDGKLWYSKEGSIYAVEEQGPLFRGIRPYKELGRVKRIFSTKRFDWLISDDYIRFSERDGLFDFKFLAFKGDRFSQARVEQFGDSIWIRGDSGLHRFYCDVEIKLRLNIHEKDGSPTVRGKILKILDVSYERNGRNPFPDIGRGEFSVLLRSDSDEFDEDKFRFNRFYRPWKHTSLKVGFGESNVYAAVRDAHGNVVFSTIHNVRFERKPLSPWKTVLWNSGGILLVTYLGSAVLASLWLRFLFHWSRRNTLPAKRRARAYVSMVRVAQSFPVSRSFLKVFAFPREQKRHKALRDILEGLHGESGAESQNSVGRFVDELKASEDRKVTIVEQIKLVELRNGIFNCELEEFRLHLPIMTDLSNYREVTPKEIEDLVLSNLMKLIPDSDESFCGDLLKRASFVFICSSRPGCLESLYGFFANQHSGNYMMVRLDDLLSWIASDSAPLR